MAADAFADACFKLEEEVDRAVNRALEVLTVEEVVKELRRLADQWAEERR